MEKSAYVDIGRRIRAVRLRLGLTQERLAESAGLSTTHVSHIETANTQLSLPTLLLIANALEVTADTLLCDSLQHAGQTFKSEITDLLQDASEQEIRVIADLVKTAKLALRKHYPPS